MPTFNDRCHMNEWALPCCLPFHRFLLSNATVRMHFFVERHPVRHVTHFAWSQAEAGCVTPWYRFLRIRRLRHPSAAAAYLLSCALSAAKRYGHHHGWGDGGKMSSWGGMGSHHCFFTAASQSKSPRATHTVGDGVSDDTFRVQKNYKPRYSRRAKGRTTRISP